MAENTLIKTLESELAKYQKLAPSKKNAAAVSVQKTEIALDGKNKTTRYVIELR